MKEHRPAMYSLYMLEDRLTEHLNTVDDEAQEEWIFWCMHMMESRALRKK